MANLKPALTPEEVKKAGVANIRIAYNKLAVDYNKILDGNLYYCHCCNEFKNKDAFYNDSRYASGLYPECKECLKGQACDYDKRTKEYTDNKEKTMEVFHKLNLPFLESEYEKQLKNIEEKVGERNRSLAYLQLLVMVKTLDQYKNLRWKDSIFIDSIGQSEDEINENSRIIKAARKRFGNEYPLSDLLFLETQYEDWTQRYACESKAQELLFQRIAHTQLAIEKAQRQGKDTDKLDKTLQDLMTSNAIKPASNNSSSFSDSKTFGQLIELWEQNKPIPQPEEEFRDVDNIALYTDVFYRGHLAKMMGLKNGYSALYDSYMDKYKAKKKTYEEEENSEALFDQIFGGQINEE